MSSVSWLYSSLVFVAGSAALSVASASEEVAAVAATTTPTLAARRPVVTCCMSIQPTSVTTTLDKTSVPMMTRRVIERW
jgi:hypothetical protein